VGLPRVLRPARDEGARRLLEFATRRAELVDAGAATAKRLWQYFEVGQSLEPEKTIDEIEEGTQPGVNVGS
jgi:hypothetical protein